jgi:hypothetical protein
VSGCPGDGEAHVDVCGLHVLIWRIDPAEGAGDLGRPRASAGRMVSAAMPRPHVQLVGELEGEFPRPLMQACRAQGRKREARDPALAAHVARNEPTAPVHREIGQADREVPAFAQPPLSADVEDLWSFAPAAGKGIHHDRNVPVDVGVDVPSEKLRQLRSELVRDLLGDVGAGIRPSVAAPVLTRAVGLVGDSSKRLARPSPAIESSRQSSS